MSIHTIKLPDVGEGVTEAEFVELHVKIGDRVEPDQNLADVMTDKATVEVPSPRAGRVVWIGAAPGDTVAVGAEIIRIEMDEDASIDPVPAGENSPAPHRGTAHPSAPPADEQPGQALFEDAGASEYVIKLPDVGEGVTEAEIVEFHVKVGDLVEPDQNLADVMTDKATVEIPSPRKGKVTWIGAGPGDTVAVGAQIIKLAVAGKGGEAEAQAATPATPSAKADPSAAIEGSDPVPGEAPSASPRRAEGGKVLAAPAVRARSITKGIDLARVVGTGPEGRITHADLDAFTASSGAQQARVPSRGRASAPDTRIEDIKVIGLRRKIAEKMQAAKRNIPHITYVEEIDMTATEELRQHMNRTRRADQPKLTVLPFFLKAMVRALEDFPQMSATYDDEAGVITRYGAAHIGVAAQTDNGLMVPVIRHAEALDIWQMAEEVVRLSTAAREGTAKREELSGSSITITSLGAIGGITTTPIINRPEVAIVGPNKIQTLPRFNANGQVEARKIMNLSSSFDHRIIDGYEAADFVQRIKGYLEYPATLFI